MSKHSIRTIRTRRSIKPAGARRGSTVQCIFKACVEALEQRRLLSNTYFVLPSGSDANSGTLSAPFQTIQKAAGLAVAGDTVEIETGTYHEKVTPANSGVLFTNYNGEQVTISGADTVPISGFTSVSGSNGVYQATIPSNYDLFRNVYSPGDTNAAYPNLGTSDVYFDGQLMIRIGSDVQHH